MDLPEANRDKVKQELTAYDLIAEEWGGTTLFAEISAKQGTNIDELLELVLIQAEMLELKANPKLLAKGAVIESKLDPGRGAVSTVLVQSGTLHVGDFFVVGVYSGKVRAMFDDKGKPIEEAGPSVPVEILGISGVSGAGDPFECVESDKMAKQVSQKRMEYKRIEAAKKVRKVTLESLNEMIKEGEVQDLNIIVKGEICCRGYLVMKGYYKNPEATRAVIDNEGWLHSGDLGVIDTAGNIYIRGRSKSMILGANGKNIYPEEIEAYLNNRFMVMESLVIDREGKLIALIYPDLDAVSRAGYTKEQLPEIFAGYIRDLQHHLPKYIKVNDFEIVASEFEKTPKKSIKRFLYQ